ncbi:MAG: hypothetical protein VCA38_16060 [Roseibacillus sp.]|jgi:DNA-binding CsgD family transcriptional regulator
MENLSPDIAKKLLTRDFTNLVARVQKGGKLTRAERAMLQSMASGAGASPSTAPSYVELAAILGVSRQSINTWKKRKSAPKPAANGLHDVARVHADAWIEGSRPPTGECRPRVRPEGAQAPGRGGGAASEQAPQETGNQRILL